MLSFGSTDGHSQYLDFGDIAATEGSAGFMCGFWVKENTAAAARRQLVSDLATVFTTHAGWLVERNANATPGFTNRNGSGAATANVDWEDDMTDGASHSVFGAYVLVGATRYYLHYFDGVKQSKQSIGTGRNTNSDNFVLGNVSNKNNGYACALGHVMIWNEFEVSEEEADLYAAIYHAHQSIPRPDKLTFYYKGTANPGIDEISQAAPTASGSVSLSSDAADAYYQSVASQWRTIASHRLMRRRTEEQIYQVQVPSKFCNAELMELVNVSHDSLPLSATRLSDLTLADYWRRFVARKVYHEDLPASRSAMLHFKDHESFGTTFWSTDQLPDGSSDTLNGLARVRTNDVLTVGRSSPAYLIQAATVKQETSQETDGQFYRKIPVQVEKINHIGLLCEGATDNPVLNNCGVNSESGWTAHANSGTLDLSTLRLAYPAVVTTRSFRFARANNSNDTYRTQAFAVLTADGYRRIYVTKSEEDANTVISWRLQRDTDSEYWNDDGTGWQVASVWNNLTNHYDGSNSLSVISREVSNAISIDANENWTLDMGLEGASLPAGGGEGNIYSISALKGYLIFSEVPTNSSGEINAALADSISHVKTATPQIVSAFRGSLTFQLVAEQNGTDLQDGDQLCLYYWQYGSTSDYDAVLYEKRVSENARFSYVRVISGSEDARAFYEIDIVRGTTYDVTAIWTDDTNGELGESNSLLRIIVDGTVGTDDNAAANHDDTDADTELWRGTSPAGTGYLASMNYLRRPRFWTRPLTNEEAPT